MRKKGTYSFINLFYYEGMNKWNLHFSLAVAFSETGPLLIMHTLHKHWGKILREEKCQGTIFPKNTLGVVYKIKTYDIVYNIHYAAYPVLFLSKLVKNAIFTWDCGLLDANFDFCITDWSPIHCISNASPKIIFSFPFSCFVSNKKITWCFIYVSSLNTWAVVGVYNK